MSPYVPSPIQTPSNTTPSPSIQIATSVTPGTPSHPTYGPPTNKNQNSEYTDDCIQISSASDVYPTMSRCLPLNCRNVLVLGAIMHFENIEKI